ncbi:MAG: ABC transporter permease subunit [bacterium]|nr:ABC transporter permease subunit [bacterium]
MASTTLQPTPRRGLFESSRGRVILENLTAYAFLTPALLIIFIFGIFPVGFAFFVSLHRWRRFPEEYRGLDSYVEALGSFALVVFFWLAIGAVVFGLMTVWRARTPGRSEPRSLLYLLPGALAAGATLLVVRWFFLLLPEVLNIPVRLRGTTVTRDIFIGEFFGSFRFPPVLDAANVMWLGILVTVGMWLLIRTLLKSKEGPHVAVLGWLGTLATASGALLLRLTLAEINTAITDAQAAGTPLPIWTYIILISAGVGLLLLAYAAWGRALKAEENRRLIFYALAAIALVIGGYFLITQLPRTLGSADSDVLNGFSVTVMYSLGTVPFQLAIGLGLAVLLFQNIKGRAFFRIVYFLPYITPFAATSLIYTILFSHRESALANQFLTTLGLEPQRWLLEPNGLFEILLGRQLPDWAAGPGLALVVIMIYNTWTYAGYSTVIFLAGLGNIPKELYEAARIDGANNWQAFRSITLPLLSPTTFFLVLVATIGTFQAFTQIYLMRRAGAYQAVDTINVYIFEEITQSNTNYAYGSAMAFVLFGVILVLTLFQNRIAGRRVFYG